MRALNNVFSLQVYISRKMFGVCVPEICAQFARSGAPGEGGGAGAPMRVLRPHEEHVVGVRPEIDAEDLPPLDSHRVLTMYGPYL